ncbi:MAG: MFS transporter [Candidatus Korobacteraceae bacterium]|jgi:MFS family permease
MSGTAIQAIDRSSLSVANSVIARDLHFSLGAMGIVLSAFGWAYFLGNLPAGRLCDRFGAKRVYGYGAALWSVASALTGCATGIISLLFSRVFVGFGESVNFPAATKVVSERFPPSERGRATGIYTTGLPIGFAVTPGLTVGLMMLFGSADHPNWRMAFFLTGIGSLIWVVLWLKTYPELKVAEVSGGAQPAKQTHIPLSVLLKFRDTWALIVIKFLNDYLYYLFILWLPGYLAYARHFNLGQLAFYSTMPFLVSVFVRPLYGFLCDKLVSFGWNATTIKKAMLICPQIIAMVAVIFAAYAESAVAAAWLMVLGIAGEQAAGVLIWVLPQDLAAKGTGGSLGGITNTAGAIASIVSPVITGFIAQYFGFQIALVIAGSAMAGSALLVMFFLTKFGPLNIRDVDLTSSQPSPSPAS